MDNKTTNNNSQQTGQVENADNTVEIVNGVACPIDPQELLQCESCQ